MALTSRSTMLISMVIFVVQVSSAQECSNYNFNQVFNSCIDLPVLQAHLHWNYIPSTKSIQIAYRANQTSRGWIAYAINPSGPAMVGSQAIVAFQSSNGSLVAYPTPITSDKPSMQPGALSFQVSNLSAAYANNEMTIFAILGPLEDAANVSHVWQAGDSVENDIPQPHATSGPNIQSMGIINFIPS
ncbi:hypothetical protein Tsubulata_045064 [Turnera subulata]|uniref:DOMON domain-containing protein n=1 Tax=Turnera subulata TaxID=218843 RepID=A0A9Q0JF06_9ROSI|nr:hypothetical protein Tsubulata_045064 [Turnera subulata]